MDIEALTFQHAAAAGLDLDARHPVDGRKLVPILAGEHAFMCAQVADAGGRHAAMVERIGESMERSAASVEVRRFVAWIARQCDALQAQYRDAPGDAITAAFEWTGWCHRLGHGNAVQMRVRLIGAPQLTMAQRAQARAQVSDVILRELKTADAAFVGHCASQQGSGSGWARRWQKVMQLALAEAFEGAPPAGVHARYTFTCSPF